MKNTDILIIGGGFAGANTAQALSKAGLAVTLVDKKDYFEVTVAMLRNIAAPNSTKNTARKPYADFIKGTFIQSSVTELYETHAQLENGETIKFKRAIIASGSRYPSLPLAKSNTALQINDRNKEISHQHKELAAAKSVLIIGGGVVGVELAGEIAHAFPSHNVTLTHSTSNLLDAFKPKARTKALEQLRAMGVKVEFNCRYIKSDNGYKDERTGETITADVVYQAIGTQPNNEFLVANLSDILNDKGLVKVDEKLRVVGYKSLYALGDVADVGEAKLAFLAGQQGSYLAKAIVAEIAGRSVKNYKRNPFFAIATTGPKTGVANLPFAVSTLGLLINMKQKDLFISKTFSGLETKPNLS